MLYRLYEYCLQRGIPVTAHNLLDNNVVLWTLNRVVENAEGNHRYSVRIRTLSQIKKASQRAGGEMRWAVVRTIFEEILRKNEKLTRACYLRHINWYTAARIKQYKYMTTIHDTPVREPELCVNCALGYRRYL